MSEKKINDVRIYQEPTPVDLHLSCVSFNCNGCKQKSCCDRHECKIPTMLRNTGINVVAYTVHTKTGIRQMCYIERGIAQTMVIQDYLLAEVFKKGKVSVSNVWVDELLKINSPQK